ncbi:MAG: nucleotide exchange factor GrpE [Acidobacteria bacterium]|nr:nucleotide exchange factor GrpE [Acidobacteriota bacterium]
MKFPKNTRKFKGQPLPPGRRQARQRFLNAARRERNLLKNLSQTVSPELARRLGRRPSQQPQLARALVMELQARAWYVRELERKNRSLAEEAESLEKKNQLMEERFREKVQAFEAEIDRIRQRLTREREREVDEEKGRLILELLEVPDNLEMAIHAARQHQTDDQLLQGVEMVRDIFLRKLERLGLKAVGQDGEMFDPHVHEAIEMRTVDEEKLDGMVVEVYQTGYMVNDRLIRPARVSVGRYAVPDPAR